MTQITQDEAEEALYRRIAMDSALKLARGLSVQGGTIYLSNKAYEAMGDVNHIVFQGMYPNIKIQQVYKDMPE